MSILYRGDISAIPNASMMSEFRSWSFPVEMLKLWTPDKDHHHPRAASQPSIKDASLSTLG